MSFQSSRRAMSIRRIRLRYATRHSAQAIRQSGRWLVRSREHTNFTYDLEPRNELHLAWWVTAVTGADVEESRGWLRELAEDSDLRQTLAAALAAHAGETGFDGTVRYGRRAGWYACVRAMKPAVVVETGVEKGLGTMVLAAAVLRNAQEGSPGRVIAVDVDPRSGALLQPPYRDVVDLEIADSVDVLGRLEDVDVFIHDSDHSAAHERRELELIGPRLSSGAVVLSDNAHATIELASFASATGRRFLFFDERPLDHWYRGAGIGAAFLGP